MRRLLFILSLLIFTGLLTQAQFVQYKKKYPISPVELQDVELKKGSFVVFDKGYTDYQQYLQWTLENIFFLTRQKSR